MSYANAQRYTLAAIVGRLTAASTEMENPSAVNTAALHPNQVELIYGDQTGSLKGQTAVWDLRTNTCTRALVPSGKVETPLRSISISSEWGVHSIAQHGFVSVSYCLRVNFRQAMASALWRRITRASASCGALAAMTRACLTLIQR